MKSLLKHSQTNRNFKKELKSLPGLEFNLAGEWSRIDGDVLENMRMMVARIRRSEEFPKRLSIVSTLSGEGVTSVALGICGTLANDYKAKVCLVDLNWYSPAKLVCEDTDCLGIADILEKNIPLEEVIKPAGDSGLYILPAGILEEYKRPVVARSKGLKELIDTLEGLFDHLILDIPALLTTSDSGTLAAYGKSCCMVIQQGITSIEDVKMGLDDISHLPILGVVINRVTINTPNRLVKLLGG